MVAGAAAVVAYSLPLKLNIVFAIAVGTIYTVYTVCDAYRVLRAGIRQ